MKRHSLRLALLLAALLSAAASRAALKTVVIYHTSDVHGQMFSRPAKWYKADPGRKEGGYAVLAQVLAREATPYLLLDSGDIFQGTPEGNLTRGDASIAAMNALGYRAMAIGNHEYDYGEENLRRLSKEAAFPFLAANIRRKADGEPVDYAKPTVMIEVGGVRFGIVGLATRHTNRSTLPANVKHLKFADEARTAKPMVEELRKEGADVVLALTHVGLGDSLALQRVDPSTYVPTERDLAYKGDIAVARKARPDLVLGGHVHTGLEHPWKDPESGVMIVQSFTGLTVASRIELTYDDQSKRIVKADGRLIDLWADQYGEAPKILDLLKTYQEKVGRELDVAVGEAAEDLARKDNGLDSPIGNWIADLMREAAGADIGVQNTYGIRGDLRKGPVTLRSLYEVSPFDNTLVVVKLRGFMVEKLIRDNLYGTKTAMQVSGMTVRYRLAEDGDRASQVRIVVGGRPLDYGRLYTVATNNYLAGGGSGAAALRGAEQEDTGRSIRDLTIEAFRKHSPVEPPATGRFRLQD